MFLGLRKLEGISQRKFETKFHQSFMSVYGDVLPELIEKDWLVVEDDRVRLTQQGLFIGNDVFEKFLIAKD